MCVREKERECVFLGELSEICQERTGSFFRSNSKERNKKLYFA